jgi:sterol desaturase/sphingolipid hydroxylase (fatty acid hydroxylase superfamily)
VEPLMAEKFEGKRNKRGDWQPEKPIEYAPVLEWPFLKWLFGYPGYFLPWTVIYMLFPIVTWLYFTPDMAEMKTFQPGWIAYILVRNLILILLVAGAWHLWLYVRKAQGTDWKYSTKWMARDNPIFLFRNQVLDNLFWTVASAVPIWTAYEVLTMWLYANNYIPYVSFAEHPYYCVFMFAIVPLLRDFHFYWIHRLIHWGPLYKWVHYLHHNNVNYGPLTGISMHPVEHLFYWSGVIFHWIVPSHPLHALWHIQHAGITPAQGHIGFEKVVVADGVAVPTGDFFHYLHHKYFECNYGIDGPFPLDRWFGTFHDGTKDAQVRMDERFLSRAAQKAAAEGDAT